MTALVVVGVTVGKMVGLTAFGVVGVIMWINDGMAVGQRTLPLTVILSLIIVLLLTIIPPSTFVLPLSFALSLAFVLALTACRLFLSFCFSASFCLSPSFQPLTLSFRPQGEISEY